MIYVIHGTTRPYYHIFKADSQKQRKKLCDKNTMTNQKQINNSDLAYRSKSVFLE